MYESDRSKVDLAVSRRRRVVFPQERKRNLGSGDSKRKPMKSFWKEKRTLFPGFSSLTSGKRPPDSTLLPLLERFLLKLLLRMRLLLGFTPKIGLTSPLTVSLELKFWVSWIKPWRLASHDLGSKPSSPPSTQFFNGESTLDILIFN